MPDLPILPSTRVAALLDRYPHLEEVLISLAPPFKKLKNPLLRKGVAKVATLQHAAIAGGLSVSTLVNQLRAAVGMEPLAIDAATDANSYFTDQPDWFSAARIIQSIDERESDPDKMPIAAILPPATRLRSGEIIELITTFVPAPGIEVLKKKGFLVWSLREETGLIRTYVSKTS